ILSRRSGRADDVLALVRSAVAASEVLAEVGVARADLDPEVVVPVRLVARDLGRLRQVVRGDVHYGAVRVRDVRGEGRAYLRGVDPGVAVAERAVAADHVEPTYQGDAVGGVVVRDVV